MRSPFIVKTQLKVDWVSHPFHPVKLWPSFGVAVKVTLVPVGNEAPHANPQTIPPGELTIDPSLPLETSTSRLLVELLPCGHPRLAGPFTVTLMNPTTTFPLVLPLV